MEALVIGGSDGYCFAEQDASLNSRAGSRAPRKGSLVKFFITNQAAPSGLGTPPFLILPGSHWCYEGIV